jgi:hypothetical protein
MMVDDANGVLECGKGKNVVVGGSNRRAEWEGRRGKGHIRQGFFFLK